ncbi:hypothetical protein BB559_004920 [Furculomyces boomerangus]|uniref:NIPSNAP domain-containing protein n=1 Tax=Furculomyces boomerangus TaxID=61424 RepID=A0A2T9YBX6_9FUNG|nr:hypothetical protein BB559_004920 [Furculomyces boomerangus]
MNFRKLANVIPNSFPTKLSYSPLKHSVYNSLALQRRTILCFQTAKLLYTTKMDSRKQKFHTSSARKNLIPDKASEIVSHILHGSKESRDIKTQFIKKLNRNKYEHELHMLELYSPKIKLAGNWQVFVGDQDSAIHIWEHKDYDVMENFWDILRGNSKTPFKILEYSQEIADLAKQINDLLVSRSSTVINEFMFWPTSPPEKHEKSIYEFRTYTIKPGSLLQWEEQWSSSVTNRSNISHLKGVWFTQLGNINTVYNLWQYDSLSSRKEARARAWEEKNQWSKSVKGTSSLTTSMRSIIMKPYPFSPLN